MKNVNRVMVVCGLVALVTVGPAFGQAEGNPQDKVTALEKMRGRWEERRAQIYEKLGLTAEQKEALKAQRTRGQDEGKRLWQQIKSEKESLRAALQADTLNLEEVYAVHNRIKALKLQLEDKRLEGVLAVRDILTQEQFIQFTDMMKEMREKRWQKRGQEKAEHSQKKGS